MVKYRSVEKVEHFDDSRQIKDPNNTWYKNL